MSKLNNIFEEVSGLKESNDSSGKEWLHRNFGKILVVILLLMSYIQLRYEYEDCLTEINKLKLERNDQRYTSIEKWGILTLKNRPEHIIEQVSKSDIELIESDEPPVIID